MSTNFKQHGYYGLKTYRKIPLSADLVRFFCTTSPLKNAKKSPFLSVNLRAFTKVRSANPYRIFKDYSHLKHYVILGIGANCGECLVRFWKLFVRFQKQGRQSTLIAISPILKNPAFGYTAQADFYNAIVWLKTKLGYVEFWSLCAYLERIFGRNRKRPFKNAPRTLDLDIIGFKDRRISLDHLRIPHIAWNQRESVRIPLQDTYQVWQRWREA